MKSILASKTVWIAIFQAGIGIIVAVLTVHPEIGWLVGAKSVIDILLRLATTQPIAL